MSFDFKVSDFKFGLQLETLNLKLVTILRPFSLANQVPFQPA